MWAQPLWLATLYADSRQRWGNWSVALATWEKEAAEQRSKKKDGNTTDNDVHVAWGVLQFHAVRVRQLKQIRSYIERKILRNHQASSCRVSATTSQTCQSHKAETRSRGHV